MTKKEFKKDRFLPYFLGFIFGGYLVLYWATTEMDLLVRHAQWEQQVQAETLFKHRDEFNRLSSASEISTLTEKYFFEQLLEFDNPVYQYCEQELSFDFLLPSCMH
ncbi:MAG: hypothetical protein V7785_10025 [Bermanella sp.]